MATILLSAAGAAIGGGIGGGVLGLSSAVIGRAVGATIGRVIDAKILGAGSPTIEVGRIDRFRLTGASEGAPIDRVHGRVRIAGQVIWSSRFREEVSTSGGGGKGAPSQPKTKTYSYSVSLAIALCEGEITRVGRIWADGNEIEPSDFTMRVYRGTEDQLPDPKMEAVEGAGMVPAYRGTAYVVIEDLALGAFGNRVPQFTFEVVRTGAGDLAERLKAVAMIPGTGEYALATTPVHFSDGPGQNRTANVHAPSGETDFATSLNTLCEELPGCEATSLIVSWFGSDLRCADCHIQPKVEQQDRDGEGMAWAVSGVSRAAAQVVPSEDGRSIYGGTPADASVIEAIRALNAGHQAVMFYPFILMDQQAGNPIPDPWRGGVGQPAFPWRGRITTSLAPGVAGSPDGTVAAEAEVAAFFGTAVASDFDVSGETVAFTGADGFSYRRFILHYAHLCAVVGGVEAFCIGSEMRSLTQIRGAGNSFPAVEALRDLAAEVRSILGPEVKIGYAADWSEYFGYHPQDGSGDVFFHLDPLWSDAEIDFVGIDNYMPLSDWREGLTHADAHWGAVHNAAYLDQNIEGGEGFEWYYHAPEAEALQVRTPITDGAYGEPWVYRYKDIRGWWSNAHHERIGGERQVAATAWVPESKPIWFTEIGCAAIDKGTNQPNKFLDPKSSESSLPKYSTGARDDLIQMQYLATMAVHWADPENNPLSAAYGGPMVEPNRMFAWAWDARPYPQFPGNQEVWSDGDNYARGHWLTGRVSARSLAAVIVEICASNGVTDVDVSEVSGVVRGYVEGGGDSARAALQPLLLAYGVDAIERNGTLFFRNRMGRVDGEIAAPDLAFGEDEALVRSVREPDAETAGRIRLNFIEADGAFQVRSVETVFPDEATTSVAESEVPLVLTRGEGRGLVERWLAESRTARDTVRFALPPSSRANAGDTVALNHEGSAGYYRIDRIEDAGLRLASGVRVEPGLYQRVPSEDDQVTTQPFVPPLPVWGQVLDLPAISATDEGAPWVLASSSPWPGAVGVYSSNDGESWAYEAELSQAAVMGTTRTVMGSAGVGLWDRGPGLEVELVRGALSSISETAVLTGGNLALIGAPGGTDWEVFQFRDVNLIGEGVWSLSHRLRGQRGTDGIMPEVWPVGSTVIVVDGALEQLALGSQLRGVERWYRFGPADKSVDHASYKTLLHTALGVALRPYAPCHLSVITDGAGDMAFDWTRRSRVDGDVWSASDVPIGEAREVYHLRVIQGGVLIREAEVSAPTWAYSANARASDGLSGAFTFEVAQISDRFGPGLYERMIVND